MIEGILAAVGMGLFYSYLIYIICNFGIPKSLSESYYLLGKAGVLFIVMMFSTAMLLFPAMMRLTPSDYGIVGFVIPSAIIFVGASPMFKEKEEGRVHKTSALLSAAWAVLWVAFLTPCCRILLYVALLMSFLALVSRTWKCYIWWLEMVAFNSVFVTLFCLL